MTFCEIILLGAVFLAIQWIGFGIVCGGRRELPLGTTDESSALGGEAPD